MKRKSIFKSSVIKRGKQDLPLSAGLAYTPSKMYDMAKKGMPISTDNSIIDSFYDGAENIEFQPLPDRMRGVDPAALWNLEQDIKKKGKKAMKIATDAYKIQQQNQTT